jgi:sugar phosphate permease
LARTAYGGHRERNDCEAIFLLAVATILATMIGYALFYFVRKKFQHRHSYARYGAGDRLDQYTDRVHPHAFSLLYGLARFGNGVLADRINGRYFMVTGLVCAAIVNIMVGFSASVAMLGILWVANAWFQGRVSALCAFVDPLDSARRAGDQNVGLENIALHWRIGRRGVLRWIVSLCTTGKIPQEIQLFGWSWALHPGWRWCFYLPAALALAGAAGLWVALRDTPSSVGLPEIAGTLLTYRNVRVRRLAKERRERVASACWTVARLERILRLTCSAIRRSGFFVRRIFSCHRPFRRAGLGT